jgi:hypothetical protein
VAVGLTFYAIGLLAVHLWPTDTASGTALPKSSSSTSSPAITAIAAHSPTTQAPYDKSSFLITDTNQTKSSDRVGEVFFHTSFSIAWRGGSVVLSGSDSGKGTIYVDDAISLTVRSATTRAVHSHIYDLSGKNCTYSREISKPIDITPYLRPGDNRIDIKLVNKCAPVEESGPIYLVGAFAK